jgi:glycosyltransferase involved in cell wall biosynthesis
MLSVLDATVALGRIEVKVGILASPWLPVPPPAYGGTESVLDVLARGLTAVGHDVVLFSTADSLCPVPRRWAGPAVAPESIGNVVAELRQVLAGYEALRDCDVVHDHTLCGPVLAARAGIRAPAVVTTAHGPMNGELAPLYRALSDRVPVIAISHAQAAQAPLPVAAVIHHGVELDRYPMGDGSGGYLAFLGRMCPEKGPHRAIEVARRAGLPLRIAAKMRESLERAFFDAAVAPRLGGDIEYVGELGWDDKVALLRDAIALVNPIAWPGPFGLVMVEALACGTPVLALAFGAAPEIVLDGRTGLLADDVEHLAGRAGELAMLDRRLCRSSVEAHFSAESMIREHVRFYERVLASAVESLRTPKGG